MKLIFRNCIIIFGFIFSFISCKAQTIYPLNTYPLDVPVGSYFKDLDNELDIYSGTWISTHNGKTISLVISKELKRPYELLQKNYFQDVLIVKYEIKNSTGQILQSTLNSNFSVTSNNVRYLIKSLGTNHYGTNEVNLLFAGGNCSVGLGYLNFKKIDSTHFYWSYYPGTTTRNDITCPPNLDYNIYLPEAENLIFTKQ